MKGGVKMLRKTTIDLLIVLWCSLWGTIGFIFVIVKVAIYFSKFV